MIGLFKSIISIQLCVHSFIHSFILHSFIFSLKLTTFIFRSHRDPLKHIKLGEARLRQNKARRSYDGPVVPPKLFPLKSKLGRVDYLLQLVQECERRYALEREFLLGAYNSRDCTIQRGSTRKLSEGIGDASFSTILYVFNNTSFINSQW